VIQPQEQPSFQTEGIQPIDVPNIEPQNLIMADLPLHYILAEHEERREP
jgi:hypothetical protein